MQKRLRDDTLSSTDFLRFNICWSLWEWATEAPMTATMRKRWMGGNRFQARACSAVKPPLMVRAELASSALTSHPWRDIHAIGFSDETGRLGSTKVAERRRRRRRLAENGVRDRRHGVGGAASPSASSMLTAWQWNGGGEWGALFKGDAHCVFKFLSLRGKTEQRKDATLFWRFAGRNGDCCLLDLDVRETYAPNTRLLSLSLP